ncbi:hypothetical protein FGO68_gene3296 [Halteria grandinella]|uniref:Uncharacterized protein n=1 Tax=Halteria grandinella TaxID=5974 RepID=A0A8J8NZ67_HALGN|nr:hypothetical protein FGO68_gene3296 [Halteria grandinella]
MKDLNIENTQDLSMLLNFQKCHNVPFFKQNNPLNVNFSSIQSLIQLIPLFNNFNRYIRLHLTKQLKLHQNEKELNEIASAFEQHWDQNHKIKENLCVAYSGYFNIPLEKLLLRIFCGVKSLSISTERTQRIMESDRISLKDDFLLFDCGTADQKAPFDYCVKTLSLSCDLQLYTRLFKECYNLTKLEHLSLDSQDGNQIIAFMNVIKESVHLKRLQIKVGRSLIEYMIDSQTGQEIICQDQILQYLSIERNFNRLQELKIESRECPILNSSQLQMLRVICQNLPQLNKLDVQVGYECFLGESQEIITKILLNLAEKKSFQYLVLAISNLTRVSFKVDQFSQLILKLSKKLEECRSEDRTSFNLVLSFDSSFIESDNVRDAIEVIIIEKSPLLWIDTNVNSQPNIF